MKNPLSLFGLSRHRNSELGSILNVSILLMVSRMGGVAANFVFNIMLARLLPPEDVGVIMVVISTTMLASILTTFNMEAGSIHHLLKSREQGNWDLAAGFVLFTRRLWLISTPIVMLGYLLAAYFLNASDVDGLFFVYVAGAVAIPVIGWLRFNGRQAIVLSKQLAGSVPNLFLRPVLLVSLLGGGVLLGFTLTPTVVIVLFALTALMVAGVQFFFLYKSFAFIRTGSFSFSEKGEWIKTGLFLSASLIIVEYFQDITLALSALTLASADTGKLAITLRLVGFLGFGLAAVNMAISPKIAASLAKNDVIARDRLLAMATHLKLWPGLIIAGLLVLLGEFILSIFGPAYVDAAPALNWLILMPLTMAVLGPNEMLLNTSGLQRDIFASASIAIVVAIICIPLGGFAYALPGAAAAAVGSFAVWEFLVYLRVRKHLGIDASIYGTFKRRHLH